MSFEDIKGCESETGFLKTAVSNGKVDSAYIFCGQERAAKRLAALNFAKALNCKNLSRKPCDMCLSCRKIDAGSFPDLYSVRPSGDSKTVKIEDIRFVNEKVFMKPYEGRYRVVIIDDAEALTEEAQNALLKTLEEPPPDTVFILIVSSPGRILPTIVSRSRLLKFTGQSFDSVPGEKRNELVNNLMVFMDGSSARPERSYPEKPELKEELEVLISIFRDAYISKIEPASEHFFNAEKADVIRKKFSRLSAGTLEGIINRLIELSWRIEANANPKLITDVMLAELDAIKEETRCAR